MKDESVFEGKLLKVYRRHVRLPNANLVHLEIVKHPGAVLIVPFMTPGSLIMLRQFRAVIGEYIWEFPAGTRDKVESPASCAQRELGEETGYHARRIKHIGAIYPVPGYSTEKIEIFSAHQLKKVTVATEPDEVIEVRVLAKKEIIRLLRTGEISDAKTIAALAFAKII